MSNGAVVVAGTLALSWLVLACGRTGLLEGRRDDEPDGAAVNGGSTAGGVSVAGAGAGGTFAAGSGGSADAAGAAPARPTESECAAQVIYSITDVTYPVLTIAAYGNFVYWSSSVSNCNEQVGRVMRGDGSGLTPAVELMTGMHCPRALAPTSDALLVAENVGNYADNWRATVWAVDQAGGVRELRANDRLTSSVTADDRDIFWFERDTSPAEEKSTLFKMPRIGGTPEVLLHNIDVGYWDRNSIALDATHVYWPESGSGIMKLPKSGGKAARVAAATDPHHVLTTQKGLFWIDSPDIPNAPGASVIRLLEWGALQPRVVVASDVRVTELWVDGATVYWSTGNEPHDGSLRRTRVDESTYDELWFGFPTPQAITGDATFVYWVGVVEHGLGAVWRVCR